MKSVRSGCLVSSASSTNNLLINYIDPLSDLTPQWSITISRLGCILQSILCGCFWVTVSGSQYNFYSVKQITVEGQVTHSTRCNNVHVCICIYTYVCVGVCVYTCVCVCVYCLLI